MKNLTELFREFHNGEMNPHDRNFVQAAFDMIETKLDGTKRYGSDGWNSLGEKGIFVDINRKYQRIKKFFWEGHEDLTSENVEDTLKDGAVYFLFMLMEYRNRKEKEMDMTPGHRTTTTASLLEDLKELMTGEEDYPFVGGVEVAEDLKKKIFSDLKGQFRYWNCLEKALLVQRAVGGAICLGSLYVEDEGGEYGFEFNLPLEFHAWVEKNKNIYDFSLPGVIEKGRVTSDAKGPVLTTREPVVLAGKPTEWLRYKTYQRIAPVSISR